MSNQLEFKPRSQFMTNFIKLNIEKEIKNNAGELQGLEWEEVYVNADNISHFKKVENRLGPNNIKTKKLKKYISLIRNIKIIVILFIYKSIY